ncbi:TetR/AcrR family transcriptional regulator [Parahaliea mediterranea]|uniref:TetR family transcriptional regulator n=1 Tax=Parahaliea mediterranea TaxID=651086 RepID=A0A939DIB8_9GAMM|nr:TetR/AcrR family transcriptional regulator [Parahaliea mediterranea]MBN7797997.1 TetR family transcriptional regulator [Parahaliea mediterranea]
MADSAPTEGRRERKKRQTRARILRAAQVLFTRHSFDGTTVEAIAEAADVSKPTLFNYFPTKINLLQALLPDVDRRFAAVIDSTAGADTGTRERLEVFFAYVGSMTRRTPNLTRALLMQSLRVYECRAGDVDAHRFPATRTAFLALIQAGIERGDVRDDTSAERLTDYMTGIYVHQLMTWLIDPSHPVERELAAAAAFLASALRPGPARH